jgi:hypothetical protein
MAIRFEAQSLTSHKASSVQIQGVLDGMRRRRFLEHPSSVAFGDTFSHKGRRKAAREHFAG